MKKILEVLQNGENDIVFNTDINVEKDPSAIIEINFKMLYAMVTKLRGGNEMSIIAVIRALAIADLAASVNMKQMVGMLFDAATTMKDQLNELIKQMGEKGKVQLIYPQGYKMKS